MPSDTKPISEQDIELIQLNEPVEGHETAVIKTTFGDITMLLYEAEAPKTVAHFKQLIAEGFYKDRSIFTEIGVNSFVTGATDDIGIEGKLLTEDQKSIECEVTPNLWHFSGAVSVLAFEKGPLSKKMVSDSRFFIVGDIDPLTKTVEEMEKFEYPVKVINAYKEYGGLPTYTGMYTVFGQVVEGMDVVNKISAIKNAEDKTGPINDAKIISIELSRYKAS